MAVWSKATIAEVSEVGRIDSEYFHPKYIKYEDIVLKNRNVTTLGTLGTFLIGPFGSAFHVSNYDPTSKYRYIRGKDVKPFTLLDEDSVFMPEKDYCRLSRYSIKEKDLLISVVGTLGNVAIVPSGVSGIFSCKSTIFRNSKINPYYLLSYFNSKYGRECLLRRQRGAIQTGLNKEDLKTIPIPIFSNTLHTEIGNTAKRALELQLEYKLLYEKAATLLETELGIDKMVTSNKKVYKVNLSEVYLESRFDALHFSPEYRDAMDQLRSSGVKFEPISKHFDILKFSNPNYNINGTCSIIAQKHFSNICPEKFSNDHKTDVSWISKNPNAVLQYSDILISSAGEPGQANLWLNKDEAVPASFLAILRPKFLSIDSFYTFVFLNSTYGRIQSKIFQSGSVQQYLYPKHLRKMNIPIISESLKIEIKKIIETSFNALNESKLLLEQAKSRVEQLIEEAAR